MDFPTYNNDTYQEDQFLQYYPTHTIVNSSEYSMGSIEYLALDVNNRMLLWTDSSHRWVTQVQYVDAHGGGRVSTPQLVYQPKSQPYQPRVPSIPIGVTIDFGLGSPQFGSYLNCYGHGKCLGLEGRNVAMFISFMHISSSIFAVPFSTNVVLGNWRCECDKDYFGDCSMMKCPYGPAW